MSISLLVSKIGYFAKEFSPYLLIDAFIFVLSVAIFFKIHKAKISKRKKIVITTIIATILFIFLNSTLLEAYFRFTYDRSDGLGFLKVSQKWQERHVRFNGDFKRDEEFKIQKPPGVTRVCAIGDSITFGYGIENPEDRYTQILEKTLLQDGYQAEVYNLAISGANFRDAVSTYRQYEFLNCDIILYQYVLNDIRDNEQQAKLLEKYSEVSPLIKEARDFSYFFDFMYWRLNQRYSDSFRQLQQIDFADFENQEKLNRHLEEISEFMQEVRGDNKKVLVAIFPMFYSLDNNYPGWIHVLIGAYFAKEGATVVDLLPLAAGRNVQDLRASRFDAHPNEYFHNLAAQGLYESIKGLILIK